MKVLVGIKRVVDAYVRVRVKSDGTGVDLTNAKMAINPFCEIAVEQAIRMKEAGQADDEERIGKQDGHDGGHAGVEGDHADDPDAPETRQRLEAFAKTTDGFELAEVDFQLRGPGELFSTKQHGLPRLRVADLQSDVEILVQARHDARQLLADDPELNSPELLELRKRVHLRYGSSLHFSDVG